MTSVYRWVWNLGPGNPLLLRVVQGGSRRVRHLWVRMGYLGALIALLVFGLLSSGGMGTALSMTELAKSGALVFAVVSYGQVALVCLLAPLFMAGAINEEHSGETIEILLTTPMSNLQIVLGSLMGRLFFVLALLASGLPLFAVLLLFGGVPVKSVFVAFAVAGLAALLVGSAAVTLAVLRKGGRKAVYVFVIVIAAYLLACYSLDRVIRYSRVYAAPIGTSAGGAVNVGQTTFLTALHPLLVLEASIDRANYHPPSADELSGSSWPVRMHMTRPLASFAALSLGLSGLMLLFSSLRLRSQGQGASSGPMLWLMRRLRMSVGGERRRPARRVRGNPIAWREAHTLGNRATSIVGRWLFVAVGLGLAAALIGLYHAHALPRLVGPMGGAMADQHTTFRALLHALLMLEMVVIGLVAIYLSAGSVSKEREDGTLDLLLTTPITPGQYVWGKLRGLVRFLATLLSVPVLSLAMVSGYVLLGRAMQWPQVMVANPIVVGGSSGGVAVSELMIPEAALLLPMILVPFVALCVAVGMQWSVKARGVLGAVTPTIAIIGALSLVLGLCGFNAADAIPLIGPIINSFSPTTFLVMLIDPWRTVGGFAESELFGRTSLVLGALAAGGTYCLIVWALVAGMIRAFDQTVRRLSGTGA